METVDAVGAGAAGTVSKQPSQRILDNLGLYSGIENWVKLCNVQDEEQRNTLLAQFLSNEEQHTDFVNDLCDLAIEVAGMKHFAVNFPAWSRKKHTQTKNRKEFFEGLGPIDDAGLKRAFNTVFNKFGSGDPMSLTYTTTEKHRSVSHYEGIISALDCYMRFVSTMKETVFMIQVLSHILGKASTIHTVLDTMLEYNKKKPCTDVQLRLLAVLIRAAHLHDRYRYIEEFLGVPETEEQETESDPSLNSGSHSGSGSGSSHANNSGSGSGGSHAGSNFGAGSGGSHAGSGSGTGRAESGFGAGSGGARNTLIFQDLQRESFSSSSDKSMGNIRKSTPTRSPERVPLAAPLNTARHSPPATAGDDDAPIEKQQPMTLKTMLRNAKRNAKEKGANAPLNYEYTEKVATANEKDLRMYFQEKTNRANFVRHLEGQIDNILSTFGLGGDEILFDTLNNDVDSWDTWKDALGRAKMLINPITDTDFAGRIKTLGENRAMLTVSDQKMVNILYSRRTRCLVYPQGDRKVFDTGVVVALGRFMNLFKDSLTDSEISMFNGFMVTMNTRVSHQETPLTDIQVKILTHMAKSEQAYNAYRDATIRMLDVLEMEAGIGASIGADTNDMPMSDSFVQPAMDPAPRPATQSPATFGRNGGKRGPSASPRQSDEDSSDQAERREQRKRYKGKGRAQERNTGAAARGGTSAKPMDTTVAHTVAHTVAQPKLMRKKPAASRPWAPAAGTFKTGVESKLTRKRSSSSRSGSSKSGASGNGEIISSGSGSSMEIIRQGKTAGRGAADGTSRFPVTSFPVGPSGSTNVGPYTSTHARLPGLPKTLYDDSD